MLFKRRKIEQDHAILRDEEHIEIDEESKVVKFFKRFKFDEHRKIERATFTFMITIIMFVSGSIWSVINVHNNNVRIAMNVNKSGESFSFSKSGAVLTLHRNWLSRDGHTAYIPFTISDNNTISSDVNRYTLFVKSAEGKLQYRPSGRLVFFGTNGRGLIEIHSDEGLTSQPIIIYLKNKSSFKTANTSDASAVEDVENNVDAAEDALFKKYDLVKIKVNPYNTEARKSYRTSYSLKEPQLLYAQIFTNPKIDKLQKQIKKKERNIGSYITGVDELRDRLTSEGFQVPKNPDWVKDDWKPDNAINSQTGTFIKSGESAVNYDASMPDTWDGSYPESLYTKDGRSTSDTDDNTSANTNENSSSPLEQWNDLTATWDKIRLIKVEIYVTDAKKLYMLRNDADSMKKNTSVSSTKQFFILGEVKSRK